METRTSLLIALLVLMCFFANFGCLAGTLYVEPTYSTAPAAPDTFRSIREAVQFASTTDTLILRAGIHEIDQFIFVNKSLTIAAEFVGTVTLRPALATGSLSSCKPGSEATCAFFVISAKEQERKYDPSLAFTTGVQFTLRGVTAQMRSSSLLYGSWDQPGTIEYSTSITLDALNITDFTTIYRKPVVHIEGSDLNWATSSLTIKDVTVSNGRLSPTQAKESDVFYMSSNFRTTVTRLVVTNVQATGIFSYFGWYNLPLVPVVRLNIIRVAQSAGVLTVGNANSNIVQLDVLNSNVTFKIGTCQDAQLYTLNFIGVRPVPAEKSIIILSENQRIRLENLRLTDAQAVDSAIIFLKNKEIEAQQVQARQVQALSVIGSFGNSDVLMKNFDIRQCTTTYGCIIIERDVAMMLYYLSLAGCRSITSDGCMSISRFTSATVSGNTFADCAALTDYGGGLYLDPGENQLGRSKYDSSHILFEYNTFENCSAALAGGGLAVANIKLEQRGNTFRNNTAQYGGGLYLYNALVLKKLSLPQDKILTSFVQNRAEVDGGGILALHDDKFALKLESYDEYAVLECVDNVAGGSGSCISFAKGLGPVLWYTFSQLLVKDSVPSTTSRRSSQALYFGASVKPGPNVAIAEGNIIEVVPSFPVTIQFEARDAFNNSARGSNLAPYSLSALIRGENTITVDMQSETGIVEQTLVFENTKIGSEVNVTFEPQGMVRRIQAYAVSKPKLRFRIMECPFLFIAAGGNTRCVSNATTVIVILVTSLICSALAVVVIIALGITVYAIVQRRRQALLVKRLLGDDKSVVNGFVRLSDGAVELGESDEQDELMKSLPPGMIIKREDIKIVDALGGGAQGMLFSAVLQGSTPVALKLFAKSSILAGESNTAAMTDFATEVVMLHRFGNHANIVRMYGVINMHNKVGIATELMRGSLGGYIQRQNFGKQNSAAWAIVLETKVRILVSVAAGLAYLHSHEVIHRDVKPANVLLNDGEWDRAVLCDFGLSKQQAKSNNQGHTMTVGTVHFIAPEVIGGFGASASSKGSYTYAIDVYSFAILVFCLLQETEQPYEEGISDVDLMFRVKAQGLRPNLNEQMLYQQCKQHCEETLHLSSHKTNQQILALNKLVDLMKQCWAQEPTARPSMVQVLSNLQGIKQSL